MKLALCARGSARSLTWITWLALAASGCASGRDTHPPTPPADAGMRDSGTAPPVDAGGADDAGERPDAGTFDAGRVVNDAGAPPDAGPMCPPGFTDCGGTCRDLRSDPASCGMCGHACGASEVCSASACTLVCAMGLTNCDGSCVDTTYSPAHCGMCGHACGMSEVCSASACTLVCGMGLTNCGGSCVDTSSDASNCGTCGRTCAGGAMCVSSRCTVVCGAGLTECGGLCVNLMTDALNCGMCGRICSMGASCGGGTCTMPTTGFTGMTGTTWEVAPRSGLTRGFQSWVPRGSTYLYGGSGSTFVRLDIATGTWTTLSSPPAGLAGWGSPALSAGYVWEIVASGVLRYDIAANSWTNVSPSPFGAAEDSMTVTDRDGNLWAYTNDRRFVRWSPATSSISYFPAMITGGTYETRVGYDTGTHALYFGGFADSALNKFDIATGAVTSLAPIPEGGLNDIFCADHSGHLYAAGAFSGTTMWQYTIATNTWARIPDWPEDHGNNGSCAVLEDGWLYVEPGSFATVWRLRLL